MNKIIAALIMGLLCVVGNAQQYSVDAIPENLKTHANAVIRLDKTIVEVESRDTKTTTVERVVTVLNESGEGDIGAVVHYDPSTKIKDLEAIILDASGNQIEKIKEKDFVDRSVVDGFSLFLDDRLKYLRYTATSYPYTVVLNYTTQTSNTAFIGSFYPLEGYSASTEKSSYEVHAPAALGLRLKEHNLEGFAIQKQKISDGYVFTAENLEAARYESYSPPSAEIFPQVRFALTKFSLEGVEGEAASWKEFGSWMYDKLIKETYDLPETTVQKMNALVADKTTTYEKAKTIFEYVQQNTRYVNVSIGIGGWKPMQASAVDELGYGDCKGLSNYTRSLLKAVGIEAYCTIIYGDRSKRNLEADFACTMGNHMVLMVPDGEKTIWLDCTSQIHPFDFNGRFIDDRYALVVKPEGGEIMRTTSYLNDDNLQLITAACALDENGNLSANVKIKTYGTQYDSRFRVELDDEKGKDAHYKNYWDNLNHLSIDSMAFTNDKDKVEFTEEVRINAENYLSFSGDMGLLIPNAFNVISSTPDRYRNRKTDLYISRGFLDKDEFEIEIPAGMKIDALPEAVTIDKEFGVYKMSVTVEGQKILYHREFGLKAGTFPKEKYSEFRKFMRTVSRTDGTKIVINKTT